MPTRSARRRRHLEDRGGSALLLVLILAILLMTVAISLWTANDNQEGQVMVNMPRVQAEYLAKGAQQLALLKARLLAQPLYDASDLAIGKNPYYPHGREMTRPVPYDHLDDTRPTSAASEELTLGTTDAFAVGPAFFTPRALPRDANLDDSEDAADIELMDRYLARYRADLADGGVTSRSPPPPDSVVNWIGQDAVQVNRLYTDPVLDVTDPYDGEFEVVEIRVLGGKDGQIHREEAIRVTVRAAITTQQKGTDQTWEATLDRVYKMERILTP